MSPECPRPRRDWGRAAAPGPGSSAADRRLGPLVSTLRRSLARCRWGAPIRRPGWRPLEIIRFQGQTRRAEPEPQESRHARPRPRALDHVREWEKHDRNERARGESNKAVDGETCDSPPRDGILCSSTTTTTTRTFAESAGNRQFYVTRTSKNVRDVDSNVGAKKN